MCCSEHCIFLLYGLYYCPFHCHVSLFKLNIKFVKTWTLFSSNMNTVIRMLTSSKWFEPRSISCLSCVIVCVREVFKKTVVGDWCFNCWAVVIFRVKWRVFMRWWSTIFLKDHCHPDNHIRQTIKHFICNVLWLVFVVHNFSDTGGTVWVSHFNLLSIMLLLYYSAIKSSENQKNNKSSQCMSLDN